MALALNPRAERLLVRLPRMTAYSALELLLIILLAVQCARLVWALVTPIGPVGEWRAIDPAARAAAAAQPLGAFDPFFRADPNAQAAAATVTSLDIRLFGTMQGPGGGSAFIGAADGSQRSYRVGEEIMPGVTLTAVGFDFVTISRGGAPEQLYLDQSEAPPVQPSQPGSTPVPVQVQPVPTINVPAPGTNAAPNANQVQPRGNM